MRARAFRFALVRPTQPARAVRVSGPGRFLCTVAGALLIASTPMAAGTCTATGAANVPAIVELYTSEGCSSCPPADRWLTSLKDLASKGTVVPLAFHIDYWDYLGWKDPYADPAYGDRHRARASQSGARVVYTPQVIVDNREFQQWRQMTASKMSTQPAKPARADLRVSVGGDAGGLKVDVSANAKSGIRGASAHVALYESGLASDVKAGENTGVLLRHDFVVRRWLGPFAFDGNALSLSQTIAPPAALKLDRSGIAVVIRDEGGTPIQAIALPLRDCAG